MLTQKSSLGSSATKPAWQHSKDATRKAKRRVCCPHLNRELSLYELAIVTRAGQAKALGLKNKGHLGVGADADVAIYNVNPETTDIAKKYKTVRRAFRDAAYTIKDGKIVVKDGEVVMNVRRQNHVA